ncbi:MAG: hypothetical protein PHV34_04230 [Verrucomicrobiae bacterium]|nr:hypothetical protein [Verrucomicrobiae bacterium]
MKTLFVRILAAWMFIACAGHAQDVDPLLGPTEQQVTDYVKTKLPGHLVFRCMEIKNRKVTEKDAEYGINLTIASSQSLYLDITAELLPELASKPKLPPSLIPPVILKKICGAGKITDIPSTIQFKKTSAGWEPLSLQDNQQIEAQGKPQASFKVNAIVFGTSEAKSVINQFRRDLAKAVAGKSKGGK